MECCSVFNALKAQHRALILAIFSSLSYAGAEFLLSLSAKCIPPFLSSLMTTAVMLFITSFAMVITKTKLIIYEGERLYAIASASCIAVGLICIAHSLALIPPAETSVLANFYPVLTAVIAWLFLHEKLDLYDCFAIFMAMLGLILISQPPFIFGYHTSYSGDKNRPLGIGLALLNALFTAMAACFSRRVQQTSPLLITLLLATISTSILIIICLINGYFKNIYDVTSILFGVGSGIFTTGTFLLLISALRLGNAAYVTTMNTCDTPTVFILQVTILGIIANVYGIIGTILVILSAILLGIKPKVFQMLGWNRTEISE